MLSQDLALFLGDDKGRKGFTVFVEDGIAALASLVKLVYCVSRAPQFWTYTWPLMMEVSCAMAAEMLHGSQLVLYGRSMDGSGDLVHLNPFEMSGSEEVGSSSRRQVDDKDLVTFPKEERYPTWVSIRLGVPDLKSLLA